MKLRLKHYLQHQVFNVKVSKNFIEPFFEIYGKVRKLEKKKLKLRMVSVKRLVLEIATRKINKIFMVPKAWFPYDRPDRPDRPDRLKRF